MRSSAFTFTSLLVAVGLTTDAGASVADANSALGFEAVSDWTIQNGTIIGTSSTRTQGAAALAVHPAGYTVLRSRLLGPLGQVSPTLTFDLGLPSQMQPSWPGATQLFVSIPSQGLYNAYVGQVELRGLKAGQYNRISFPVPDAMLAKLRADYQDLTFAIVLNVPASTTDQYLLDNFEVSSSIPPNSTVGLQERLPILGFEVPTWTISGGSVVGLSTAKRTAGMFALGIKPNGYNVLTSPPLPSIGPVASTFSFDLWQPPQTPVPATYGAAQLFVTIPSQGVYNAYLGQVDLLGKPRESFSTLSFSVPPSLLPQLNAQYTDLRFGIALNVPTDTTGTYYIDNFQVGNLTAPLARLPGSTPPKQDLFGAATTGLVTFTIDGVTVSPAMTKAEFVVEELDRTCLPTGAQACRYIVHRTKFRTAGVSVLGTAYAAATAVNVNPFEVVMGGNGPGSLSSPIPSNIPYVLTSENPAGAVAIYPGPRASITISPAGAGMIAMSGQFQGAVDGHELAVNMAATADSPLANRPPVASAGPDQTVWSYDCRVEVTLDGSASSDPDNNIHHITWYDGNTLVAVGTQPKFWISRTGVHVITAVVQDAYASESQDQMLITANVQPGCASDPPPPPPVLL